MREIGLKALAAKDFLATVTTEDKNRALLSIAKALRDSSETIITQNKTDLETEEKTV